MTLDEKLVDLLHFMPGPAGRGHCRHGKKKSKVVLLCHVMAQVVRLCCSLACEMYIPPQHITKDLRRRASLPYDAASIPSNPHSPDAIARRITSVYFLRQSTLITQRRISAQCSSCCAISWRKMFFDNRTLFTLSTRGLPHLMEVVGS